MTTIYSRPGGQRAGQIAPAPSYAGVVSKYANEIVSALEDETNNRINALVLSWRQGAISWDDFLLQYQTEMDTLPEGSAKRTTMGTNLLTYQTTHLAEVVEQKRAELTTKYTAGGTLSRTDEYNIERELLGYYESGTEDYNRQMENVTKLYAYAIDEKVENKRAELLDKFSGGGITPTEQLNIVNQLLLMAPVGTDTYRNLMTEKAQALNDIETEKKSLAATGVAESKDKASQAYEFALYHETTDLIPNYESGRIDGLTADQTNLDNWKNVQTLMQGLKGQVEGKTIAYVNEKVTTLTEQVRLRTQGRMIDAVTTDNSGNRIVSPVKTEDIIKGVSTGVIAPKIDYDADADVFKVYDPRTGKYVAQATNEADALRQAKALAIPGMITVKTAQGEDNYYYDTNKDSSTYNQFIKINAESGKPEAAYPMIPVTPELEQFKVPIDKSLISKSITPTALGKLYMGAEGLIGKAKKGAIEIGQKLGVEAPTGETFGQKAVSAAKTALKWTPQNIAFSLLKGIGGKIGGLGGPEVKVPTPKVTTPVSTALKTGGSVLKGAGAKVVDFLKGLFT